MQTLRRKLVEQAKWTGLRLDVIQQDYLLTLLLQAIGQSPALKDALVFKGGTALKKCYFGEYRFSEDLDFTAAPHAPRGALLANAISQVCWEAEHFMNRLGPVRVSSRSYQEKERHPHHQEAFSVYAQFPWQREPLTRVMIEVTFSENLVLPTSKQKLLQSYEEGPDVLITTYSLDEIILEKLRAVLQQTKKLHERSWSRSRARDYYDLWHILCQAQYKPQMDSLPGLLESKCRPKEVSFEGPDDFFLPIMISDVTRTWERWVGNLVTDLPPIDRVIQDLKEAVSSLFEASLRS